MTNISFDFSKSFVLDHEIEYLRKQVYLSHDLLHTNKGAGKEFTGWILYPQNFDKQEYEKVKIVSRKIRQDSDVFVVIGIGGSYLGSRACIEALNHHFYNLLDKDKRKNPQILFSGNNMSGTYIRDIFDVLENKDVSINVISKSGTTTETAIAFRIFKKYMEQRYGKVEAAKRIYVTTDTYKGALKRIAQKENYQTFTIPNNIGGRYSVLTSVGLLPIAVSGINIDNIMEGAKDGMQEYSIKDLDKNISYQYALIRNILYNKGKQIELLVSYEPNLFYLQEWWKQLFGESEGKDLKGIYPSSVSFSTDLHSLGQFIQDGKRNIFETVLNIKKAKRDIKIEKDEGNIDSLNFLEGKTMNFVNDKSFEGTLKAHICGNVPNIIINIPAMNEYYLGKLIYFFEKACAISGYILGVNPFDQPGVEQYKKNVSKLIGRPNY